MKSDLVHHLVDACCGRIARLLCQDGQPAQRSLAKLVEKGGLARSTVMLHLKHLEEDSSNTDYCGSKCSSLLVWSPLQ